MTNLSDQNELSEFPILLVDDETQINDLLNQVSKSEFSQSTFIHLTNYEEAVAYLEAKRGFLPRLILLDVDFKTDKTGLDLLSWIRAHEQYRLVPVIMLSVVHEESVVRDAYERGANAFTNKPFTYDEWKAYVQYLRTYWFVMASTPKLWVGK